MRSAACLPGFTKQIIMSHKQKKVLLESISKLANELPMVEKKPVRKSIPVLKEIPIPQPVYHSYSVSQPHTNNF
jgi:hypothetical protein